MILVDRSHPNFQVIQNPVQIHSSKIYQLPAEENDLNASWLSLAHDQGVIQYMALEGYKVTHEWLNWLEWLFRS